MNEIAAELVTLVKQGEVKASTCCAYITESVRASSVLDRVRMAMSALRGWYASLLPETQDDASTSQCTCQRRPEA